MSQKSPVSFPQNIWFDSEQVDDSDLTLEQEFNTNSHASFISNHVGTGALSDSINQAVLFDSDQFIQREILSGKSASDIVLDGRQINVFVQPSDQNYGNQLEIELSGSSVAGKRRVKIAIIGKDFQGNLQFDTFVFSKNERQYTKKHYTNVLLVLLNDFVGPYSQSMNLGGRIKISEAPPLKISRDPIMVAQNIEPNIFFRDFFTTSPAPTLQSLLINSLPFFNVDTLGIYTGYKDNKVLAQGDTTTQIGQKFLATTNNIQKVRLLLSVKNSSYFSQSNLVWGGDLIVSIYPLQSSVNSVFDIVPDYAIDFSPSSTPIAQLTYTYDSLRESGFILDGTPQPIDFVFSNTSIANGSSIISGKYYAITVRRAGANACDIMLTCGSNRVKNSKLTMFSQADWYDFPEDNLWFEIYTDSVKLTDGQAYENGHGIIVDKVTIDDSTGQTKDYSLDGIPFYGSHKYSAVLQSKIENSGPVQDQRTGNLVFSRKQSKPNVNLLTQIELNSLQKTSKPFVIGSAIDANEKYTSSSLIYAKIKRWTFLKNKIILKSDQSTNDLVFAIKNGSIVGAKITPNDKSPSNTYNIAKADIVTMKYGDINGDGIVDFKDVNEIDKLLSLNLDLNFSPPTNTISSFNSSGVLSCTNGYYTFTRPFKKDTVTFEIIDPVTMQKDQHFSSIFPNTIPGSLDVVGASLSSAQLKSPQMEILFGDKDPVTNKLRIAGKIIYISSALNPENIGIFTVSDQNPINVTSMPGVSPETYSLNIQKLYYDQDLIMKIMRADVDHDFAITAKDKNYIGVYVDKVSPENAFLGSYPFDQQYYNNVGKDFDVIVLHIENDVYTSDVNGIKSSSIDRSDDFYSAIADRGSLLHAVTDICANDPVSFINKSFISQIYSTTNLVVEKNKNTVFTNPTTYFNSVIPGGILPGDTIRIVNSNHHLDITRTISKVRADGYMELDGVPPIDASLCDGYIFRESPITLSISKRLTWDESLVRVYGIARHVPSVISYQSGAQIKDNLTQDIFDSGSVDFYIPNNLVVGSMGEITRPDGNFYKVDFEVGTITIEIPDGFATVGPNGYETKDQYINVFDSFVAEDNFNKNLTSNGFRAMRFADGSAVKQDALAKNQVRFSVSVQSFSPNTEGVDSDGYSGVIVDGRMGVAIDYATGMLALNFANLKQNATVHTESTKIQISVFLKKGGFNNAPLLVNSMQTQNMLKLAGLFTSAGMPRPGINAPSVVTDLSDLSKTKGTLPISRGGTGITSIGPAGTVLSSDGTNLVYDKKNPMNLVAFCGVSPAVSNTPSTIGAFRFTPNSVSTVGLSSLKIEAILETSNTSNPVLLRLYSVTDQKYIDLDSSSEYLQVAAQDATLIYSKDLSSEILSGSSITPSNDYIYEVHLSFQNAPLATDFAVCKMVALTANYDGPTIALPPIPNTSIDPVIVNTVRVTGNAGTTYAMKQSDTFVSVGVISGNITITLPISAQVGQQVFIKDSLKSTSLAGNTISISGNGSFIDGSLNNIKIIPPNYSATLIYDGVQWCTI